MMKRHLLLALAIGLLGCAGVGVGDNDNLPDLSVPVNPDEDLAQSGPNTDLTVPSMDDLIRLKDVGELCTVDAECTSNACKSFDRSPTRCVQRCAAQPDCSKLPNTYCEPSAVDATEGFCVLQNPKHCASCAEDRDCGWITGSCMQGPNDSAKACKVDCSLSADACPEDYTCASVTVAGKARKLCMPKTKDCLDNFGGYCDRTPGPQPCDRTNVSGICSGQRGCLANGRYDVCGAMAPRFKMSCQELDPAGCKLLYAPGAMGDKNNCGMCGRKCAGNEDCCGGNCLAIDTVQNCGRCGGACGGGQGCCGMVCTALNSVQNCGACGNACPGVGQPSSDVTCADPGNRICGMTCRGENFDVNKQLADGCERVDVVPPGHTQQTAASRGGKDCYDGASSDSFGAQVTSDGRVHQNPSVASFNGVVGAAPDVWSVNADGGTFCQNDYDVTFTTTGGGNTACYKATIATNKGSQSVTVTGNGRASMSSGSGSYSGGSVIYFTIEKTCSLAVQEAVGYTLSYHL